MLNVICHSSKSKYQLNNIIIIEGGTYSSVRKALRDWVKAYDGSIGVKIRIRLFEVSDNKFLIKLGEIDNELFFYLVNYLKYPINVEYEIKIIGYTIGEKFKEIKGKELMIFISSKDTEYTNVFAVTKSNENYKIDFSDFVVKMENERNYKFQSNYNLDKPETIVLNKLKTSAPKVRDTMLNRTLCFSLLSTVIILLAFLFFADKMVFGIIHFSLGFAFVGWMLFDYKILQKPKLFVICLSFAVLNCFIGIYAKTLLSDSEPKEFITIGYVLPMVFLVLQKILRFIFKYLMKREPVVDKPAPSVPDFFYVFVLFLGTILPTVFFILRKNVI